MFRAVLVANGGWASRAKRVHDVCLWKIIYIARARARDMRTGECKYARLCTEESGYMYARAVAAAVVRGRVHVFLAYGRAVHKWLILSHRLPRRKNVLRARALIADATRRRRRRRRRREE